MLLLLHFKVLIRRKLLFLVLISCVFLITVIGMGFIWNYFQQNQAKSNFFHEEYRAYTAELTANPGTDRLLADIAASEQVGRVRVVLQAGENLVFANYSGESPFKAKVANGRYFTTETYAQKRREIILTEDLMKEKKLHIGEEYSLFGKDFTIIGTSDFETEIPYAALTDRSGVVGLMVITKTELSGREQETFFSFLGQLTGVEVTPPVPSPGRELSLDLLMLLGVALLGLLNISFVYLSYLESRRGMIRIYYLVGCRKSTALGLLVGEMLLLFSLLYAAAVLALKGICALLAHIDALYAEIISPQDYIGLYLMNLGMVAFLVLIQAMKFFNRTPYEIKGAL